MAWKRGRQRKSPSSPFTLLELDEQEPVDRPVNLQERRRLLGERHSRFSAKAIAERMHWETAVKGGSDFKISNAVTAYMAKRFIKEHPGHGGLFKSTKRKMEM